MKAKPKKKRPSGYAQQVDALVAEQMANLPPWWYTKEKGA